MMKDLARCAALVRRFGHMFQTHPSSSAGHIRTTAPTSRLCPATTSKNWETWRRCSA